MTTGPATADPRHDADKAHLAECLEAILVGTAVGDAIGLPYEGLPPRRARQLFGGPPLRHRLFFGYGTISDDTDHAWMTTESLLASAGNPDAFVRSLAWRLRFWLLSLPAGTGLATARAIFKLWVGVSPAHSGVYSAGNGPAMRSAILGVFAARDHDLLRSLVRASTRITHTNPAAEQGALAVAVAAAYATELHGTSPRPDDLLALFREFLSDTPILALLERTIAAAQSSSSLDDFLREHHMERGVTGYINHTVPAAIFCWLRSPADFRTAVEQVVLAGGDTDSTAAIVGALTAISAGTRSIPAEWLNRLVLWPRTLGQAHAIAHDLAASPGTIRSSRSTIFTWLGSLPRNLVFLAVVLFHGFRRLLPPY